MRLVSNIFLLKERDFSLIEEIRLVVTLSKIETYTGLDETPFTDHGSLDNLKISDPDLDGNELNAITELFNYPFRNKVELNQSLSKYNGAERINIIKEHGSRIVRSPRKFLTILKLFASEASVTPSYGLKVKKGSRVDYVHFILELNETSSVGIFFYDSKRMLSVPQIHNVERLIKQTGLAGGIIIANKIGIPAKQEANRINDEHGNCGIITIEHYDSLEKRYLENL